MTSRLFRRPKMTWPRILMAALGVGAVGAAFWWGRQVTQASAEAAPLPQTPPIQVPPVAPPTPSDYTQRVVAYLYGSTPVTREQLGEYLIARLGEYKVNALVNKVIVERAAAARGFAVTDAEIDAMLSGDLAASQINKREFLDNYLRRRQMSLYEWREDVLRPKILMTKLLRERARPSEEDLRRAFESFYGEKVVCQAIFWPKEKHEEALSSFDKLRSDPAEFERQARAQADGRRAAVAGMMEPFGRYGLGDDAIEAEVFRLKEGEVTGVLKWAEGPTPGDYKVVVLKLLRRIPADKVTKFADVRPLLEKEVVDRQVAAMTPEELVRLRQDAEVRIVLPSEDEKGQGGESGREALGRSAQAVAFLKGGYAITREHLGEFLISRYGVERLELCLNRLIIQKACFDQKIAVSDAEVDMALQDHLRKNDVSVDLLVKEVLRPMRVTLWEFREDNLRMGLQMSRMVGPQIVVDEEDLKKGFQAYYGDQFECRLILWPRTPRDHEIAIKQYDLLRRNEAEFDRATRTQANGRLAAKAGQIPAFGLNGFGNETVEREVAKLSEGEITPLIETPEGYVVLKLVKKHPARANVTLAGEVRARLEQEARVKKTQMMVPTAFARLREAATPNLLLKVRDREEDLNRQVESEIRQVGNR